MYSFIYLGCVPFTTAKLTKGGWFNLLVSSLNINTFGEYGTVYNVHFWLV